MKKIQLVISAGLLGAFALFLLSCFSGTILWLIYEHIHKLFPNAAINGVITQKLSWWDSICITWICSILFKTSISTNKDK